MFSIDPRFFFLEWARNFFLDWNHLALKKKKKIASDEMRKLSRLFNFSSTSNPVVNSRFLRCGKRFSSQSIFDCFYCSSCTHTDTHRQTDTHTYTNKHIGIYMFKKILIFLWTLFNDIMILKSPLFTVLSTHHKPSRLGL